MSLIQKCQVQTQKVEVKERVNGNTAWHVYYYNENQIEMFRDRLTGLLISHLYIVKSAVFSNYLEINAAC